MLPMINRYNAACHHCEKSFIFRVVVPYAKTESLCFCCPCCNVELRAGLSLDLTIPKMDLSPVGFTLSPSTGSRLLSTITVSTEIPVHRQKHLLSLPDGGSPFLFIIKELGKNALAWKNKIDTLQFLREHLSESLQTLLDRMRGFEWHHTQSLLEKDFKVHFTDDSTQYDCIYSCYRTLNILYVPLISPKDLALPLDEYFQCINHCIDKEKESYRNLLEFWAAGFEFKSFRSRVLTTFIRVLINFDAFITGLLVADMPESMKSRIDDFRIFRTDYDIVKALYQDLFELTSQATLFFGPIVNLAKRQSPWKYVTGVDSHTKFRKLPAFERFKILDEMPWLKQTLGTVSRPMRNCIGHFSAEYETFTGNLRYDDGSSKNYIIFLGELADAVKALRIVLAVVEKIDLDMCDQSIM